MRKSLPIIAVIGGVLAFAALNPGFASAHTGTVTAACVDGQPTANANLTNYNGTNDISIRNDGIELTTGTFGASYQHTFNLGSPTVAHVVVFKITAHDDPNNARGFSPGGTINVPACQEATTTTVAATTTTVAPTTTTVEPTTTTVEPTTTTVEPTTTTVEPATTTTLVASEGPATPTTTIVALVASAGPVPPTAAVPLPATGYASGTIAILGLAMFGLGLTLLGLHRRSRPVSG